MVFRAFRFAAVAALVLTAVPAAAQQFSDSYEFLEAVRKSDGTKVSKFLQDKSLRLINTKDRNGDAAMHIVARRSDELYLRVVLQAEDSNINIQDRRGNTGLLIAVQQGWLEGVNILIKYKANVNLANSSGETPLIAAVQVHDADIVRALLAAGANPDRADFVAGKSARDYAREQSRYPQIARLLEEAPKAGAAAAGTGPKL
jgi:uncharacterized protein